MKNKEIQKALIIGVISAVAGFFTTQYLKNNTKTEVL